MSERRHEPLITDVMAFECEFPEKAPWHVPRVRFSWIVPSNATTIVRVCLLLLAGGFAAQHSRVPANSDLCGVLFAACVLIFFIPRVRWFAFLLLGFTLFLQAGIGSIDQRLEARFVGDSILAQIKVVEFVKSNGVTAAMIIEPVDDARLPRRSRVTWFDPPRMPEIGDIWELELRLRRPRGNSNPGGFSLENWMFRERLHAGGYVVGTKRNRLIRSGEMSAVDAWRRDFVIRAESHFETAAPILAAIGVGARHLLSREQWDHYAKTGTSHLMAISGLHIGLAAAAAFACIVLASGVLRLRGNHLDFAASGSIAAAGAYALMSGFAVPSQRAFLMLVLGAVAILSRRRAQPFRILAIVAVIVFVADPVSMMAPGFSLSFGAVAALLWFGRQYTRPVFGRRIRQLALMQLALLLGLMPLTVIIFQRIAFAAPLTNFVVVPIFSFITVPMTLASMLVHPIWEKAAAGLLAIAAMSVVGVEPLIEWVANQAFASTLISGVGGPGKTIWLYVLLPALWVLLPRGWPGRWLAWLGVVALLLHKPATPPNDCLQMDVLDVGQGLSVVLQSHRHVLVFDTGASYRGGGSAAEKVVMPFLRYRGIRKVDWLIVSHADDDHAGGVAALTAGLDVERIFVGEALPTVDRESDECTAGLSWRVDGIDFEFLHPASAGIRLGNDASCVLLISTGRYSVLLTGDIEADGEQRFLSRWLHDRSDIVVIPHHGSLTSSSPAFVNRLRPDFAIASAGFDNRWDFPKERVVRRWEGVGATVLDTGSSGAVSLSVCQRSGVSRVREERQRQRRFWHDP